MNDKLKKALVLVIGGFLAISAVIYYVNNGFALPAEVAHEDKLHPKEIKWGFEGPFGTFDKQSIQRGYKVYKEVCASCHSMNLIAFRNLTDVGFSEAEVKAIAAEYSYPSIDDDGEPTDRAGVPNDKFHSPYANKEAAAAANGGAIPPDLSLIIKAREDGANYVYSLLTGYVPAPEGFDVLGKSYNPYFSGRLISMAKPLQDGQVDYTDGTKNSLEQQSKDVVNFLQWAAEPEMQARKRMGLKVLAFLAFFTVFFYIAKVRVWARVK